MEMRCDFLEFALFLFCILGFFSLFYSTYIRDIAHISLSIFHSVVCRLASVEVLSRGEC